ncbi:hypothetical protein CB1_000850004 [Camelus ferus]|nr:hypothetical protein CB1_000850004 [Camelus ferus]
MDSKISDIGGKEIGDEMLMMSEAGRIILFLVLSRHNRTVQRRGIYLIAATKGLFSKIRPHTEALSLQTFRIPSVIQEFEDVLLEVLMGEMSFLRLPPTVPLATCLLLLSTDAKGSIWPGAVNASQELYNRELWVPLPCHLWASVALEGATYCCLSRKSIFSRWSA